MVKYHLHESLFIFYSFKIKQQQKMPPCRFATRAPFCLPLIEIEDLVSTILQRWEIPRVLNNDRLMTKFKYSLNS